MIIPTYPQFASLKKEHKDAIESLTSKFDSYSDFNFTSLLCWNTDESAEISLLNDNLVIKLPDYITGEPVLSILGAHEIDDSLAKLSKITPRLELVPEIVIDNIVNFKPQQITPDRDNDDYIFNIHNLCGLEGGQYKKVRNKISRFERDHSEKKVKITKTSIVTNEVATEILGIYDQWAAEPDNKDSLNDAEKIAISRLLDFSPEINFVLVEMIIDEKLVGFSFNEILPMGNAICHFEKAIDVHEHTYSYFVHQVAVALLEFGCDRVNWEQDLGLPGLRQSKTSHRASEMLKKYTIIF